MQSQSFDFMESLFSEASALIFASFWVSLQRFFFQPDFNRQFNVGFIFLELSIYSFAIIPKRMERWKQTQEEKHIKDVIRVYYYPFSSIKWSKLGYSSLHRQTFRALLMESLILEFSINMQHSSSGPHSICEWKCLLSTSETK